MKKITFLFLLFLLLTGCKSTTDIKTIEQYRYYLGSATMNFLVTTMHTNALYKNMIKYNQFTSHDFGVLKENYAAITLLQEDYEASLQNLYRDSKKRERDKAVLPLFKSAKL